MDPTLFSSLQLPEGHFTPSGSAVLVYGFGLAAPALLLVVALISAARWRIRAALEKAAMRPGGVLAPGRATISGKVERAAGTDFSVSVEIEQQGSEGRTKFGWRHTWTEKVRLVKVRPFYLRLDSGERVRIEAERDLIYADEMDGTTRLKRDRRIRFAALEVGERVFVHGVLVHGRDPELEGGYREGGMGLVLQPPPRGKMMISAEPPGARFRRRARARVYAAIVTVLFGLVVHAILSPYHSRVRSGRNEQGTITRLTTAKGKKNSTYYYALVSVKGTGGRPLEFKDSLGLDSWRLLRAGALVPTRFVESWPSASVIGWGATVSVAAVVAVGLSLLFSFILYLVFARRALTWHDGRRLVETGEGPLDQESPAS